MVTRKSPIRDAGVSPRMASQEAGDQLTKRQVSQSEYVHVNRVTTSGATAPDGTPWVKVEAAYTAGAPSVWTPLADWADDAAPAKRRLREVNLHLFGEDMKDCVEAVRRTRSFPSLPLIDRPGWTGTHFGLPSGKAYSPKNGEPAIVLYRGDAQRYAAKGTKAWLTTVAHLANGQSLITFALMLPFMGPLLKLSRISFNPGFELTGPPRVGKSTLQQLVASIIGPAVAQDGQNAWLPANITTNALEERLVDHADFLMIIEEMSLFYADAGDRTRGAKLRDLVFKLANGTAKSRYQSAQQKRVRLVYLTSSNETLSALIGSTESRTSAAAGARLLTIPIDSDRPLGIFDKLPKGFESSEAAVRAITNLIEDHHGHPIRRFISKLVEDRAGNEEKLKQRIARHMDKFREAAGIDDNVGSEASIADVFGLAYAAGMLARHYGALPMNLAYLKAVTAVYKLNRALGGPPLSHAESLRRLTLRRGVIHINPKKLQDIPDTDLHAAPALVRLNPKGEKEILLTEKQLVRAFPLKREFFKDPEVQAVMQKDTDDRRTVKRTVRTNKRQERLYCFLFPASQHDN